MKREIFGIDLGTAYSSISYIDENGKPQILSNFEGQLMTPSVVFFEAPSEEGGKIKVTVGQTAKNLGSLDPDNVVAFIKQKIGSDWKKEFYGMEFTPETISAEIIKKLVRDAGELLQTKVEAVVITRPTHFERASIKTAVQLAGLNVIEIIDEPVAAALHYGIYKDRTAIVYDLGATFNVAVISFAYYNKYTDDTVVCSDGDQQLGGKLWDERLVNLIASKFAEQTGMKVQEILNDRETYYELTLIAETAKIHLSNEPVWKGRIPFGGNKKTVEITREEFDKNTKDLLARTEELTQAVINRAKNRGVDKIDDFLLVGGSTKMPQVLEMIKKRFASQVENEPSCFEPEFAVAKGAAIFETIDRIVEIMWA